MLERGCRHFIFTSRSGAETPKASSLIQYLADNGASVQVHNADASNEGHIAQIIAEVDPTRRIRGVVHAAMVLKACEMSYSLALFFTDSTLGYDV